MLVKASVERKKLKDNCGKQSMYAFCTNDRNPDYQKGLRIIPNRRLIRNAQNGAPFESCHKRNNAEKDKNGLDLIIKTLPKWITYLKRIDYNPSTGELFDEVKYSTNELKRSNARKIKALNSFCNTYQPLYKRKRVSLFFLTLTSMDNSRVTLRELMDIIKYRLSVGLDRELLGYVWTLEVSEGLHCHYHLCLAVKRVNLKGKKLTQHLKLNEAWGCRSEFEFVRKDVKRYLSKYFAKDQSRILNHRSYGISRNLRTPN
jgi:hypothetical protein